MKKTIIVILLCVVIAATFGYSAIKLLANGPETNSFNRTWRPKLSVSPILRTVFGLHFDGDARADYLGKRFSKIQIEVDSMSGYKVPYQEFENLAAKIQNITGKSTTVLFSDADIPYQSAISDKELEFLAHERKSPIANKNTAKLYVFLASSRAGDETLIGSTLDEFGLVAYWDSLSIFTEYNPNVFNSYMTSTLFHEFGHQLGLAHNTMSDCLMNEAADERSAIFQDSTEVVSDFCPFEVSEIQKIKATVE